MLRIIGFSGWYMGKAQSGSYEPALNDDAIYMVACSVTALTELMKCGSAGMI